jgi:hypothetical protein
LETCIYLSKPEERLLEREELDDLNLNRELEGLATSESILEHREAALEVEQKALEDAHGLLSLAHR